MNTMIAASPTCDWADLLLVRMLLTQTSPKKICSDLGKILPEEPSVDSLRNLQQELAQGGFLKKGRNNSFSLTDSGRQRALRYLGVSELPPRMRWSDIIARYLFPKVAGLTESAAAKLRTTEQLAAFLLKRKYQLGAGAGATLNQVMEALVCQQLGYANESTLQGLLCAVLSNLIGSERLPKDQLTRQLPLFDTGLNTLRAEAIRRKIVQEGFQSPASSPKVSEIAPSPKTDANSQEAFDLEEFAATVKALAADSPPQDRFHNNKVFIAALWRASQQEPSLRRFTLDEFKQHLLEANAKHLLHLSRADFVQAMDPQLVEQSATTHLNATFHFVLIEGTRS